jgi:CBS domain containing-hemolysin-like protein
LVEDEHGTVVGVVTLENVLEPIVGAVEDEFDNEAPMIVEEGKGDASCAETRRWQR